ncbi:MAG: hypothetical protein R2776_00815 [Flavobacteriaceae bacterium]|nr:hypothetical protein [Flavobacteriaceae bacterium]
MKAKKYSVLAILFLLPITVYLFFASGVNNFAKLPVLTQNVSELSSFTAEDGTPVQFQDRITVLGFFGKEVENKKAHAFNLAHKIYKKNYQFEEFQFVILVDTSQQEAVLNLKEKLNEIANPVNYRFAFGTPEAISEVFNSLQTNGNLNENAATNLVFIIDKERNLRGREADDDAQILYGFDASNYAEINNKMSDDIMVVLAEYRLALKKYKTKREI